MLAGGDAVVCCRWKVKEIKRALQRLEMGPGGSKQGIMGGVFGHYEAPKDLAKSVLADVMMAIELDFPKHEGSLGQELVLQSAASESATARMLVGNRERYFEELDQYVMRKGPQQPFVLYGAPGAGKSSVVSQWAERLRAKPALATGRKMPYIVLEHYATALPDCPSNAYRNLLALLVFYVKTAHFDVMHKR